MANTVSVNAKIGITAPSGTNNIGGAYSVTPTGTKWFGGMQVVNTTAETLAIGDCASLGEVALYLPSDANSTVTVTCAAILIKPGRAAVFMPSSTSVTLVSTAATGAELATGGTEV